MPTCDAIGKMASDWNMRTLMIRMFIITMGKAVPKSVYHTAVPISAQRPLLSSKTPPRLSTWLSSAQASTPLWLLWSWPKGEIGQLYISIRSQVQKNIPVFKIPSGIQACMTIQIPCAMSFFPNSPFNFSPKVLKSADISPCMKQTYLQKVPRPIRSYSMSHSLSIKISTQHIQISAMKNSRNTFRWKLFSLTPICF